MKSIKRNLLFMGFSLLLVTSVQGQPFKVGTSLCEIDWKTRDNTRPSAVFGYEFELKSRENLAEAGNIKAQYQLGFVRRTYDGKWSAPNGDYSYNIKWLQKAVDAGHKSAAARLAEIGYKLVRPPTVDLDTYLATLITATEAGNSWEASELMDYTREFYQCTDRGRSMGYCSQPDRLHPLIKKTDLSKWAEIAGLGGNPAAQEWMCHAAFNDNMEYGQPKDDKKALRWCLVAAHNSCSVGTKNLVERLFERGDSKQKDIKAAEYWHQLQFDPKYQVNEYTDNFNR